MRGEPTSVGEVAAVSFGKSPFEPFWTRRWLLSGICCRFFHFSFGADGHNSRSLKELRFRPLYFLISANECLFVSQHAGCDDDERGLFRVRDRRIICRKCTFGWLHCYCGSLEPLLLTFCRWPFVEATMLRLVENRLLSTKGLALCQLCLATTAVTQEH